MGGRREAADTAKVPRWMSPVPAPNNFHTKCHHADWRGAAPRHRQPLWVPIYSANTLQIINNKNNNLTVFIILSPLVACKVYPPTDYKENNRQGWFWFLFNWTCSPGGVLYVILLQSPVLCGQQVCVPPLCRDTDRSVWRECPMYVPAPASGTQCGLADRAANFAKFHSTRRRALLGLSPCWKCLLALLQSRIYAKQALHTVVVAFFRNCKLRECLLQLYCGGCSVGGAAVEWSPCGQHLVVPHQHRGAEHTHFHIDICTCYCEFKFLICLIDFLNDQNPHPPVQCNVGHCRLLIGLKLFTKMSADSMNVWPVLHGGRAKDAGGVGGYLFFYFFAVCTEPRPPPARPQPLGWQNKNSGCSWQRCSVAWLVLVIYGRPPSPAILITAALLHFEIIQLGI